VTDFQWVIVILMFCAIAVAVIAWAIEFGTSVQLF